MHQCNELHLGHTIQDPHMSANSSELALPIVQVNHYNGFIDQYSPSGDALTMEEVRTHLLQLRQQLSG